MLGDRQQFIAPNAHVKREESLKTRYVRIYFKKLGVGVGRENQYKKVEHNKDKSRKLIK